MIDFIGPRGRAVAAVMAGAHDWGATDIIDRTMND
jgi:hypothetical protein